MPQDPQMQNVPPLTLSVPTRLTLLLGTGQAPQPQLLTLVLTKQS